MVVSLLAQFDGINASRYTTCRTLQSRIAVLVAHPICGGIIFPFGCIQVAVVHEIQSTASIRNEMQTALCPNFKRHVAPCKQIKKQTQNERWNYEYFNCISRQIALKFWWANATKTVISFYVLDFSSNSIRIVFFLFCMVCVWLCIIMEVEISDACRLFALGC